MPGDISRDFASSLSKLHYEVESLKKSNKELVKIVEDLVTRVETSDTKDLKQQRQRVLQAAAMQDAEEIERLRSQAVDVTERELLRMFAPTPQMEFKPLEINRTLIENMKASAPNRMPELRVEIEEEVIPYVLTEEYRQAERLQALEEAEQLFAKKSLIDAERKAAEDKRNSNALRKLSPLWDI